MKKFTAVLLTAAVIMAAAGCDSKNQPTGTTAAPQGETTQAADTSKSEVTAVVVGSEAPDTSDDAMEFLKEQSPLFAKYLAARRNVPVTLETIINKDGKDWISNIYIKDDRHAAIYSKDPDGNEVRMIYSDTWVYQIESDIKTVYAQELGTEYVDNAMETFKVKLSFSDVGNAIYSGGTGKVSGVEYTCEAIGTRKGTATEDEDGPDAYNTTVYYFDKDTGDLAYIDSNDVLTKIVKFENSFDREDMFDVPEDYTRKTIEDLRQEYVTEESSSS